ncbi:MAG: LysR family transcriptional regulator [Rhizobiaceae bacterium]|nr:MAG: LysR family transcriptional regulator [Rhizobiaceae bacterium]
MRLPNLRQLYTFRVLMQTQNVTEAARQLNVTQPAVSKMIASLETELGMPLFRRIRGRIYPSSDAVVLLAEVEQLFAQIDALQDGISSLRSAEAGSIAIAAIPTLAGTLIADCLSDFARSRPGIHIFLVSESSTGMLGLVGLHKVELGFMYDPPPPNQALQADIIGELEIIALLHRDHPIAGAAEITPKLLADQRVILWDRDTPPSQLIREAFARDGVVPHDHYTTNSSSVAKRMAINGIGVALLDPSVMIGENRPELVVRAFRPRIPLRLYCIQSAYRPPSQITRQFLAGFRSRVRNYSRELQTSLG